MIRAELIARIQKVGAIEGVERAEAVLRTVLEALQAETAPEMARQGRPAEREPDWQVEEGCPGDICEREEMLCEEEVAETH